MPSIHLSARLGFLVFLVVVLGGYFGYTEYQAYLETRTRDMQISNLEKQRDPMRAADVARFRETYQHFAKHTHAPISIYRSKSWHRTEMARQESAIGDSRYDYIVLPVVEMAPANDRVSRLMSARWIANEVEMQLGKRVLSPELTLRALGGRATLLEDQDVTNLANRTGADVIHLFLNPYIHLSKEKIGLAAVIAGADGTIKRRVLYELDAISGSRPLEIVVEKAAADIVSELFESQAPARKRQVYKLMDEWVFPEQLTDLVARAKTPLDHAAYLQYIALLTPKMLDYERRRLFERSLLALDFVDPSSDYYNLLKARALFHLYRRPAALGYLKNAALPADKALKEYLNGNHPELQALLPEISNPLLQAAAYLEFVELNYDYRKGELDKNLLSTGSAGMQALMAAAIRDGDIWYAPDNVRFFGKLRGLLPEFDSRFEEIVKEQIVSGGLELFSENESLLETVFSRARGADGPACCPSYQWQIEESDLWGLYRNLSVANLFRQLDRSVNVHANYGTAKKLAERLEPQFQGHPRFLRLYAEALEGEAKRKQGEEKMYLIRKAYSIANEVFVQSGGADYDTVRAHFLGGRLLQKIPPSELSSVLAGVRYRSHVDVPSGMKLDEYRSSFSALLYTNDDFYTVMSGVKSGGLDDEVTQRLLDTRFNGHPKKPLFLATRLQHDGRDDDAIDLLGNEIEMGNTAWSIYNQLGEMLIDRGEYGLAGKTFLSYPGFRNPGNQRVKVSNFAYEAGSRLFWLGYYEEATPLYKISAALSTGAESEYASAQRLSMLQGDMLDVISYAYKRGQRYNSYYGFRDYLAFMHMLGFHENADSGFKALATRYESPQLWTSLFVGHRKQGRSVEEVKDWADGYLAETGKGRLELQAKRYAFMYSVVDRRPERTSVAAVTGTHEKGTRKYHHIPVTKVHLADILAQAQKAGNGGHVDCMAGSGDCETGYNFDMYDGFLDAYLLYKSGKYNEALEAYVNFDKNFPVFASRSNARFALPYMAMAVADSQPAGILPEFLKMLDEAKGTGTEDFDLAQARAIIHAQGGETEKALQALTAAFHARPHTIWRPLFSWYQLTETAEWLSKKTGDRRFTDKALEWAKRYQKIQPQFAWAYAFEALYSENAEDRIRAAGFAAYLDSQSAWLEQVPGDIRKQGVNWWEKNNPYNAITDELDKQTPSPSNEA